MARRAGYSLIELLLVVVILAILIALTLVAIQKVRAAAALTVSKNNLRQLIFATHQLASDYEGSRVKGLARAVVWKDPLYLEMSIFEAIRPYTHGPVKISGPDATQEERDDFWKPYIKCHVDPADPTIGEYARNRGTFQNGRNDCSYACNMMVFDGIMKFPWHIPDGNSNTIGYTTKYFVCQSSRYNSVGLNIWAGYRGMKSEDDPSGSRRATFADKGCFTVMPVTDPATKQTVPSIRGLTFQVRPPVLESDRRIVQTPHYAGLPVAMLDGSVRTISPRVTESGFWSAVTPDGGEVSVFE